MRKNLPFLAVSFLTAAALVSGCANTERKFGRDMSNMFEIVRGGEFRRSMEQTGLFEGPDTAYGYGTPLLAYYNPLSYLLAAPFELGGLAAADATRLVFAHRRVHRIP